MRARKSGDNLIPEICAKLSVTNKLKSKSIILHCSGSLNSDILFPLKKRGCYIASIHPMRSFAEPALSVREYNGTYCALEGDVRAYRKLIPLFKAIGSIVLLINKNKKHLYHAAGVFATNYLVTLANEALKCLEGCDIEHKKALHIIINYMQGTLANIKQTLSLRQSLTGPVQRADMKTIEYHLNAITQDESRQLYSSLGKATLSLTNHSEKIKEDIENIFSKQITGMDIIG